MTNFKTKLFKISLPFCFFFFPHFFLKVERIKCAVLNMQTGISSMETDKKNIEGDNTPLLGWFHYIFCKIWALTNLLSFRTRQNSCLIVFDLTIYQKIEVKQQAIWITFIISETIQRGFRSAIPVILKLYPPKVCHFIQDLSYIKNWMSSKIELHCKHGSNNNFIILQSS